MSRRRISASRQRLRQQQRQQPHTNHCSKQTCHPGRRQGQRRQLNAQLTSTAAQLRPPPPQSSAAAVAAAAQDADPAYATAGAQLALTKPQVAMLQRFDAIIQSHVNPVSSAMPVAAAAAATQDGLPGSVGAGAARPRPPAPGTLGHLLVLSAADARKHHKLRTLAYLIQTAGVAPDQGDACGAGGAAQPSGAQASAAVAQHDPTPVAAADYGAAEADEDAASADGSDSKLVELPHPAEMPVTPPTQAASSSHSRGTSRDTSSVQGCEQHGGSRSRGGCRSGSRGLGNEQPPEQAQDGGGDGGSSGGRGGGRGRGPRRGQRAQCD